MRARTLFLRALVFGTLGAAGLAAEPEASHDDSTEPTITTKETEAVTAVSIEHDGPYWSLGGTFEKVPDYMASHHVRGPLFVRYSRVPTSGSGPITMEVGFLVHGPHEAEAPFKSAAWPKRLVVTTRIERGRAHPSHVSAQLDAWCRSHGFETLGPMIEIYPDRRAGTGDRPVGIEIQMPIRTKQVEKPAPPADPDESAREADTAGEPPRQGAPAPSVDEPAEAPAQADEPGRVDATDEPDDEAADEGEPTVTLLPAGSIKEGKGKLAPLRPVADLVNEKRFKLIAEQLLPDADRMHPDIQVWVGQLFLRVRALGRGAAKVFPEEASKLTRLIDPIEARYRVVAVNFERDPRAAAAARVDNEGDPKASGKEAVLRDLDRLLGRVAVKTISADETVATLVEILERAQTVVRTSVP